MKATCGVIAIAMLLGFVALLLADGFRDARTLVCSVPVSLALLAFLALSWVRNENKRVAGQGIILGVGGAITALVCWGIAAMIILDPLPDTTPIIFIIVGIGAAGLSVWYFSQAVQALGGEQ